MLLSLLFGAAGLSASPWLRGLLGDDAGSWLALGLAAQIKWPNDVLVDVLYAVLDPRIRYD